MTSSLFIAPSRRILLTALAVLLGFAVLLAAGAPGSAHAQAAPLTLDQLKNATYPSTFTASKSATLVDGAYSEAAAPGSASLVQVQFVDAAISPDFAAVVLATSGGGSGTFYTLHLVTVQDGAPFAGAGLQLGDRIKLNSIAIVDNQVRIDMTTQGPTDPMCCPTQDETRIYGFGPAGFSLLSTTPATTTAPPAPAATGMAGTVLPNSAGVTLQLALLALALLTVVGARRRTQRR
jgi:hypothetical protein